MPDIQSKWPSRDLMTQQNAISRDNGLLSCASPFREISPTRKSLEARSVMALCKNWSRRLESNTLARSSCRGIALEREMCNQRSHPASRSSVNPSLSLSSSQMRPYSRSTRCTYKSISSFLKAFSAQSCPSFAILSPSTS